VASAQGKLDKEFSFFRQGVSTNIMKHGALKKAPQHEFNLKQDVLDCN
jgi:hypothetical protein